MNTCKECKDWDSSVPHENSNLWTANYELLRWLATGVEFQNLSENSSERLQSGMNQSWKSCFQCELKCRKKRSFSAYKVAKKETTDLIFSLERKIMVEMISNPQETQEQAQHENNCKGRKSKMKMEVYGRCRNQPHWCSGWHLERHATFTGAKLKEPTNQPKQKWKQN